MLALSFIWNNLSNSYQILFRKLFTLVHTIYILLVKNVANDLKILTEKNPFFKEVTKTTINPLYTPVAAI